MQITKLTPILLAFFMLSNLSFGQDVDSQDWPELSPASIPSAPAFSLLGVNPEIITRPSDIKEFKVDWRIKNYKLAPDLALEGQPLWHLHFKKKGPNYLMESSQFLKILSTTSVSLATAKIDNVNHLAWALKCNLYKEHSLLDNSEFLKEKQNKLDAILGPLQKEIDSLNFQIHSIKDIDTIRFIKEKIRDLKFESKMKNQEVMQSLNEAADQFVIDHWNMSMLDAGFGRVYTYNNSAIDSLRLRKAGYGIWINGGKSLGKQGLLSGMIKINRIGINSDMIVGASYRYGSYRFNFFAELVMNRINNNPENGFLDEEQFSDLRAVDLGVGWYGYQEGEAYTMWNLSYGGDFRLNNNILLNFSLRTNLNNKFKFNSFVPIANIICLMQ